MVSLSTSPLTTLPHLTPLQPCWPPLLFPQRPTSGPLHELVPLPGIPDFRSTSSFLSFKALPDHPTSSSHLIRSLFYFLHSTNANLKLEIYLVFKKMYGCTHLFSVPPTLPPAMRTLQGKRCYLFYSLLNPQHPNLGLAHSRHSTNLWE